jgi:hypothetical protein
MRYGVVHHLLRLVIHFPYRLNSYQIKHNLIFGDILEIEDEMPFEIKSVLDELLDLTEFPKNQGSGRKERNRGRTQVCKLVSLFSSQQFSLVIYSKINPQIRIVSVVTFEYIYDAYQATSPSCPFN